MADYTMPAMDQTVADEIKPIGASGYNPLTALSGMTELQQRMNQMRLFNEQMKARQQAGSIMATSPDMDTAMQSMSRNPQVMGYMPDILNTIRQADLTNTQLQGARQTQGDTALHSVMQSVPSAMTDLSSFDNMMSSRLATLPPSIQAQVKDSVGHIRSALFDGLPDDPKTRQSAYNQRWNAMMIGGGFTPDQIAGISGTPKIQDVGGGLVPGVQAPGALGGGFTPAAGAMSKTLAPQVIQGPFGPGGAQAPVTMGGGLPKAALPFTPLGGNALTAAPAAAAPTGPMAASSGNTLGANPSSGISTGAASGVAGIHGPSIAQTDYMSHRGVDVSDYEKSLDDRVGNGATLRRNVGEVVGAMRQAQTGGGAQTYSKLGQALQAIGVNNDTVDKWANGSLASSQVIDKVALQNSMSQLKQQLTGVGGSRLNAQEFVAYLNKNPNLVTDPKAAVQIFNLWNQFYDRDKQEQQALDKFKSGSPTGDKGLDKAAGKNYDIARWPSLWNQSDYMRGFAPGGEISSAGVKGAAASGLPADIQALIAKHLKPSGQ